MYILFEYVTCVAFAFVAGASLFVATMLVLFAKEIMAKVDNTEWLGTMTPFRPSRLARAGHQVI